MSLRNKLGGKIAKANGARFEQFFLNAARHQNVSILQIPSGMRIVKSKGRLIPIAQQTPCDFILAYKGSIALVDTKSVDGSTFAYSAIKSHQLGAMALMARNGCYGGYVINFNGMVYFFDLLQLGRLKPRESLKPEAGVSLGRVTDMILTPIFNADIRLEPETDVEPLSNHVAKLRDQ